MATEAMDSSALLHLLRWRRTTNKNTKERKDHGNDLTLDHLLQFLDQESCTDASTERQSCRITQFSNGCNIPPTRILHEIIKLAIDILTQSTNTFETHHVDSFRAIRLLHAAILKLAFIKEEMSEMRVIYIPVSTCNLLLSVLTESIENITITFDILSFLLDYKSSDTFSLSFAPRFTKYKPTVSVWMGLMSSIFDKAYPKLVSSLENKADSWVTAFMRLQVLLLTTLKHLQRAQTNKKKAFLTLTKSENGLLQQLVKIRVSFERFSRISALADVIALIQSKVDSIFVEGLLDDTILCEFKNSYVYTKHFCNEREPKSLKKQKNDVSIPHAVKREFVSYPHNLFDALLSLILAKASDTSWQASVVTLIDLICCRFTVGIRNFSKDISSTICVPISKGRKRNRHILSSSSATHSPFRFWAELCGVVFTAAERQSEHTSLNTSAPLVAGLFTVLRHADIYRVTEDTDDKKNFQILQKIFAKILIATKDVGTISEVTSTHICSIIADAAQCAPNLIGNWLPTVFRLCGHMHANGSAENCARGMACVLKAFESMRLLQEFYSACFQAANDATTCIRLCDLLSHTELKSAISHSFSRLPSGQMEPFWTFCMQSFQSACMNSQSALAALIRMLFDSFLYQIHVTPDTRHALDALMIATFDQILPSDKMWPSSSSCAISRCELEILALFGSLTSLYDDISESIVTSTFGRISFFSNDATSIGQRLCIIVDSLDKNSSLNGGVLRFCAHWLHIRKDNEPEACAPLGERIAHFVVRARCWSQIAYSLSDLAGLLSENLVDTLLLELVVAYVHEEDDSETHPRRIFQDASFYEIVPFHKAISRAVEEMARQLETASSNSLMRFYGLLLSFPEGYLDSFPGSNEPILSLLSTSIRLQMSLSSDERVDAQTRLTQWITTQLCRLCEMKGPVPTEDFHIAMKAFTAFHFGRNGVEMESLMQSIVAFCCKWHSEWQSQLLESLCEMSLERSALLIEIFARLRRQKAIDTQTFEAHFIQKCVGTLQSIQPTDNSVFSLVYALLQYYLAVRDQHPQLALSLQSLFADVSEIFRAAMTELLTTSKLTRTNLPAWKLYLLVCENHCIIYDTQCTKGFGRLLAAALCVLQADHMDTCFQAEMVTTALLAHARSKEFRLFVFTAVEELSCPLIRVFASLRALHAALFHSRDGGYRRKVSASRRDELIPYKMKMVEQCAVIFGRCLLDGNTHTSVELAILNMALKLFASLFCTPEMFTWRAHELSSILLGFQPIQTLASRALTVDSLPLMDEIWRHSYMLLLRVLRHHFSALVSCIPQMIFASNSLLRVLIAFTKRLNGSARDHRIMEQWASNLTRLYGYMKPHDVSFRKHIVYLLMESLTAFAEKEQEKFHAVSTPLWLAVQEKLQAGHFALLDICSSYEKEQLFQSLNASGKSLFKKLNADYNLKHRYHGNM